MSINDSYGLDDAIWAATSIQEGRYAIAAMCGILLYEWFSGLEKEIRLVYLTRWNSVKVSYLLCRYYPMLLWPAIMWGYVMNHPQSVCNVSGSPLHVLLAPCQFFPQAVMFMRAFAFSGRSHCVIAVLGVCYASLVGVDIWVFCAHIHMPPAAFYLLFKNTGCFPDYGLGVMGMRIGFSMLAATLMDLLSLITVLMHCRKVSVGGSLARYFIQQGYVGVQGLGSFIIVTAVNAAAAIAFFRPPSYHTGIGLPLVLVVPNLVACRVILQLRGKASPTDSEIRRRHSMIVNVAFATDRDMWVMDTNSQHDASH